MKLLAADTATRSLSVAILDGTVCRAELTVRRRETHSRHLMGLIDQALALAGLSLDALDGLVAVRGPGSFTGLRIGLSALKGLAMGAGKPMVGVSALEALAHQAPLSPLPVHVLMDARKGQVYQGIFQWEEDILRPVEDPGVRSPEAAAARVAGVGVLLGDGARLHWDRIHRETGGRARLAPEGCHTLRAGTAARLGSRRFAAGEGGDPARLTPQYLRKSDAELALAAG
jgi:tRNA threonylcarbamoyladenosine biosynthesis protein TsaB